MAEYKAKLFKGIYTPGSNVKLSDGRNLETVLNGNIFDLEYSANANMTHNEVLNWIKNNLDYSKISLKSIIVIANVTYALNQYTSNSIGMFTSGTLPNGIYITSLLQTSSVNRAFRADITTTASSTDLLSQTMLTSGSKIQIKY